MTSTKGEVGILNVGAGDTKLSFDKANPAECIRAARVVTDMIRRGYALRPSSGEIVRDAIKQTYGADPRPVRPVDYKERQQISGPGEEEY